MDKTKQTYNDKFLIDKYFKENETWYKSSDLPKKFITLLKGRKIIDIGCGPGLASKRFIEEGFDVVGIDYSEAMVEKASEIYPEAQFIVMDMLDIDKYFVKNSFDGAWISASLIHIEHSLVASFLEKLKGILTTDGVIFFGMKTGTTNITLVDNKYYGEESDRTFYIWEEKKFLDLLETNHFRVIECVRKPGTTIGSIETNWSNIFCKIQN